MKKNNTDWSKANQHYLSGLIKLLRARIENYTMSVSGAVESLEQPVFYSEEKELKEFEASMTEQPAIEKLATIFGLTSFEKNILLMCAAADLESGWNDLVTNESNNEAVFQSTFGFGLTALPDAHWSAISPASPLRYWRFVEVNKTQSLTRSPLRIDEHILHYITGIQGLHEKLSEVVEPFFANEEPVPSQQDMAKRIAQAISSGYAKNSIPVISLQGNDYFDKLEIASYASSLLNSKLYTISGNAIPINSRDLTELVRLWSREAALNNYILFMDASNIDANDKQRSQSVVSFIENTEGVILLNTDAWTPELKRSKITLDIGKPLPGEQIQLWKTVIGKNGSTPLTVLDRIVSQFNLGSGKIRKVGLEVTGLLSSNGTGDIANHLETELWKACCHHTRPQVDELAQRIEPMVTWDDIVLPDFQKQLLKEIVAQVKHRNKVYNEWGFAAKGNRGLGISALFSGESGTGKTMASEVLANELALDLYKIDLSKVVNKYIGETEKNLKKIFDAAEEGGAILLFDEADALFGKRSDVKDSHDRYSNIEVSYLLQRMEAYRGLAILTTNMKSAVDKAFMRRIRFVIQFQFPDAAQRAEIWSKVFPKNTPIEKLDLDKLARLSIAGGSIRNIAMNAAFMAANENSPVSMMHIYRATRSEYDKTEKAFNSSEFRGWV